MTLAFRVLLLLAVVALLPVTGCGNGDGSGEELDNRFTVQISRAEPLSGYAPLEVRFEASAEAIVDGVDLDAIEFQWSFGDGQSATGAGVTHTFDLSGDFLVALTGIERKGEAVRSRAEANATVSVSSPADLAVSRPVVSPAVVTSEDNLRVTFDLDNFGAAAVTPFEVGIFAADSERVDPLAALTAEGLDDLLLSGAAIELEVVPLSGLGAAPAQVNIDRPGLRFPSSVPTGRYFILAFADTGATVGEVDEGNNVAFTASEVVFTNTSQEGPDLTVRSVSARPSRANRLETVAFDATIANVGTAPALLFSYSVYLSFGDPVLDSEDVRIGGGAVENVSPTSPLVLDDMEIDLEAPIDAIGQWYLLLEADSDSDVAEINETNNVGASLPLVVTDEPIPGVDVVSTAFAFAPDSTFLEGSIALTGTVLNQGVSPAERQFLCRVYLSTDEALDTAVDPLLDSFSVLALDAGESAPIDRVSDIPGFFDPGEFHVFLFCDASLAVAESDEDNNVRMAEGTLAIAPDAIVDIVIDEFTLDPMTVDNDSIVSISAVLCNAGSNGSTPSVLRVLISEDPEFDETDTRLAQISVPPIDADDCVSVEGSAMAVCDTFVPEYTVFVLADATGLVPELDEENNLLTLPDRLAIDGPVCACEDDRYEPNDSPASPAYLNPDVPMFEDLTMCTAAVDWYAIPLLRGETLRIVATFDNDRGNVDLVLYGADRATVLDTSSTDSDREEVSLYRATQRGDYLLKVAGRTPEDLNLYDLELSVSSPEPGVDLTVLDVETDRTSAVLGEEIDVTFEVVNLGDSAAGGSVARLFLSDDPFIDPVADTRLGELFIDAVTDRVERTVSVILPPDDAGGDRFIGVIADARNDLPGEVNEENNIGVSPSFFLDAGCFDTLEPNNSFEQSRTIELLSDPPVVLGGLLACSDNRDFYTYCVEAGDFLAFTTLFDGELGDLDIKLYDEVGAQLLRSEGVGDEERVEIEYSPRAACYTLEVYIAGADRELTYDLVVDTGRAPEELQCDSDGELNESYSTAAPLRDFLGVDLAVCPDSDEDYYWVNLAAGSRVTLALEPASGETAIPTALRTTVWGPSRNFLANTVSAAEEIVYTVAVSGRHYIRVRSNGSGPRSQPYRVRLDGVSGIDLVPSDFELDPAFAAPGDQVQFTFTLSNARDTAAPESTYAIYLSTDPLLDESDRLVRSVIAAALPGLSERSEGRKFTIPADLGEGGAWYAILRVDDPDAIDELAETNNTLLAALAIANTCGPDAAEPNDFSWDSVEATDFDGETMTICPGDADWFHFSATPGRPTRVEIFFTHADGDLDLFLFNSAGDLIGTADSLDDDESVVFTPSSAGPYSFFVEAFDASSSTTYTFDVR